MVYYSLKEDLDMSYYNNKDEEDVDIYVVSKVFIMCVNYKEGLC